MEHISEKIAYIGTEDKSIDLFENQYPLKNGVTYNSYIILDEKTAVLDSVDSRCTEQWLKNIKAALGEKRLDYFVISHLEPDHSGSIEAFLRAFPETTVVTNAKAFSMLPQFLSGANAIPDEKKHVVKEGDVLTLGSHSLTFCMAPMVHWPEVMVSYEAHEKILFSADAFGTFGIPRKLVAKTHEEADGWADEARRYFINIVGKYGGPVQNLLKKACALDIAMIAPLHGPVIAGDFGFYLNLYDKWSRGEAEECGVLVAYATLHGNTAKAAEYAAQVLRERGKTVAVYDLSRSDVAEVTAQAFKYDKLLLAGVTYDGGLMPCMEDFLYHLKIKNYANRTAALIQNGSWGPISGKCMKEQLEAMKNVSVAGEMVTLKSTLTEENKKEISALLETL